MYVGATSTTVLKTYSNADFAANLDDRRSTLGVVLMLNGGPLLWEGQRQTSVSLLTTESEYVAAATAAKETVWMRRLLQVIGSDRANYSLLRQPERNQAS